MRHAKHWVGGEVIEPVSGLPTVLHVVNSLDLGGTEKQLYLLLKYLDRAQFRSKVLALSTGGYWTKPIRELGVELREIPRRGSYEFRRLLMLRGAMRRGRPSIVHTWHPAGNLYGGIAARLGGCPRLILSYRSIDRHSGLKAAVETSTFSNASAVVCNSRALADDLRRRGLVRVAPTVVYNGIEDDPSDSILKSEAQREAGRAELGLPQGASVVANVGRMVPFKNQSTLLEIAAEVLRRRQDCYFLLIGDGPSRSNLEALSRRLGVSEHVIFLGSRNDVGALLRLCDAFVFPSRQVPGTDGVAGEGFPNAVMEAMQAGLPCIASTASGAPELFRDGEAGFLLNPDDKQGFANALLRLLRDPMLRSALGDRGRDIITSKFGAATMARQMAEVYRSVMSKY
jgi:glycosyltransferase involved in cell wall biosynthesis